MKVLLLFIMAMAFTMTACTKDKLCDTGKVATGLIASQISVQLDCKNKDAVAASIEEKLVDLKVCEQKPADATAQLRSLGSVGAVICGPVVEGLAAGILKQIPKEWECSGGNLTEDLKLKLLAECSKAF